MTDTEIIQQFRNFLTWALTPGHPAHGVPPAVHAYVRGLTEWCPRKGEM